MLLPIRRLLNLLWHWVSRDAGTERRQELLDSLSDAAGAYAIDTPARPATAPHSGSRGPLVRGRAVIPGTSTHGIRPPSWWKGDRAAWRSSIRAAEELGEPAAAKAGPPRIGSRG